MNLNMNDTFHYACGDSEELDSKDVEVIIPIIQKYGNDVLVAYSAIRRGYDPTIPQRVTEEFKKAKEELIPLAEKGDILVYQFLERESREEEKLIFDGQIIEWKSYWTTSVPLLRRCLGKQSLHVAKLADGTIGIGHCKKDAKDRLIYKYQRKKKLNPSLPKFSFPVTLKGYKYTKSFLKRVKDYVINL
jgi:hypothetical protein